MIVLFFIPALLILAAAAVTWWWDAHDDSLYRHWRESTLRMEEDSWWTTLRDIRGL